MRKKLISSILSALLLLSMVNFGCLNDASAASASNGAWTTNTRNVALGADATASGQCNAGEAAAFAVDGSDETKWCDNSGAKKKWLMLDLGDVYVINQWVVKNAAISESAGSPFRNTKNFRLQKSDDGLTWEDVDVVRNNVQTIVDRYVPAFETRYVRLYIDQATHDPSNIARIYEFELYGVDVGEIPEYPPVNLDPVDYVDPFINTLGDNGQTNPGATTPFSLVFLGPDSDGGAFSGYYYESKYLKGFSHLRFNGVGCSGAGGNILMMPTTRTFTTSSNEYKSKYDKKSEQASPGYYGVTLATGIRADLTASDYVGFHRYTFPELGTRSVLVDLSNSYAGMIDASLKVESDNEITGMVKSKNVCGHGYYVVYFSIQFDQPFTSYTTWEGANTGAVSERTGTNIGVWLDFDPSAHHVIQAKVGLSPVSVEQARYEREHDIPDWDFDAQRQRARAVWSELLGKIEIRDPDEENKKVFYTQLYHSFLHPTNVTSSLGTFKAGRDENTVRHVSEFGDDFVYYNGWTTWDDFRKYPLYSILVPKTYENIVKSLVDLYRTRGTYTQWGSGYWPSPTVRNEFNGAIILDAYAKGFTDFDVKTALYGMAEDADKFSVNANEISGYLERAKSAYFPARLAMMTGDRDMFEKYRDLAQSYRNLWNPDQVDENGVPYGFFTPNAAHVDKSDVTAVDKYAYQGNLWTYRFTSIHDIYGLAELMGGKRAMAEQLMDFFGRQEFMLINEPHLEAPYLFNYLGYPYLTQYYVRKYTTETVTQKYHNHGTYTYPIKSRVYRSDPEGYLPSMDDDGGAMSSWFVYSAMGLFPGNPGDPYYLIGSPIFEELTIHLDGGKTFTIKANNVSAQNRFIQSAKLNGKPFDQAWILHEDIMAGGILEFEMGPEPNVRWGAALSAAPPTMDYDAAFDTLVKRKELIPEKSVWHYWDRGSYPGADWTDADFDDSGWSSGPAILGYGGTGVNTTVSYGPDPGNRYPTTYFRKTFELDDLNGVTELEAGLIRDDGAIVYLNGREIIRTNMPDGPVDYNTYASGTVNSERDWNVYRIDPSLLVQGTNVVAAEVHQVNATSSDIAFDFKLLATIELERPQAPTNPVVDDKANTFGWTFVPGYEQPEDYEFSVDGGVHWKPAASNPIVVGPVELAAGQVQVRVKADESRNRAAGQALASDRPFTSDIQWDVFDLNSNVSRAGNMKVTVSGKLIGQYADQAMVVFQLMDDRERAFVSNAVPVETGDFEIFQIFNVNASKYQLNIYLVDEYNGNIYESLWLAEPIVSRPEPHPGPKPGPDPEDPPEAEYPEPLPLPEEEPDDTEEPELPEPLTFEFEDASAWSEDVNTFNNNPLKTEGGNGGVVVANTFTGAWLRYNGVDLGAEGVNRIAVTYDAPVSRTPDDIVLEVRLGDATGELVGTVNLYNTGSGWGSYRTVHGMLNRTITGVQDICLVLVGSTDSGRPFVGNLDRFAFELQPIRADYGALELESFDGWSLDFNPYNGQPMKTEGGKSGQQVANTFNGAWLVYKAMDFGGTGVNHITVEYAGNTSNTAPDAAVEIRLGFVDGPLVGKVSTPPTGSGWGTYKTASAFLTQTLTGIHDVYFVLVGSDNATYRYIGNFDNAKFSYEDPDADPIEDPTPEILELEFENRTEWSSDVNTFNNGPLKTEAGNGGTVVANTFTGAWLAFDNVDFGTPGKNYVEIVYDAPTSRTPADIKAEIRLGDLSGELVGSVDLPNTGSGWGNYITVRADLMRTVTVTQSVYFIVTGSTDSGHPFVGNFDKMRFGYKTVRTDFAPLELETFDEWSTALNPANNAPLKTENGKSGQQVANTFDGAWLAFKQMDFGTNGVNRFSVEYAGNSSNCAPDAMIEIRIGGVNGTLVGTVATPPTGSGWGTYKTVSADLTQTLTGVHDVYFVMKGTTDSTYKYIGNFDNARFWLE